MPGGGRKKARQAKSLSGQETKGDCSRLPILCRQTKTPAGIRRVFLSGGRLGTLPRPTQQSAVLLGAHCGAPACSRLPILCRQTKTPAGIRRAFLSGGRLGTRTLDLCDVNAAL